MTDSPATHSLTALTFTDETLGLGALATTYASTAWTLIYWEWHEPLVQLCPRKALKQTEEHA